MSYLDLENVETVTLISDNYAVPIYDDLSGNNWHEQINVDNVPIVQRSVVSGHNSYYDNETYQNMMAQSGIK